MRRVAICGSPLSGKRTLIEALATAQGWHRIEQEELPSGERLLKAEGLLPPLNVVTSSGHVFLLESVAGALLEGADVVIYLLSPPGLGFDLGAQEVDLALYGEVARNLGVDSSRKPWIFAVNKIDAAQVTEPQLASLGIESALRISALSSRGHRRALEAPREGAFLVASR